MNSIGLRCPMTSLGKCTIPLLFGAAALVPTHSLRAAEGKPAPKAPAAASTPTAAATSAPGPAAPTAAAAGAGWLTVDYGSLVDRRRLSHSGEPVGVLLSGLGGRPFPVGGERPEDALAHILLDPLLEPYAFILSDALDALEPALPAAPPGSGGRRPLVEVGSLWQPGESEPAWVELLRSRHFIVESDGSGSLRVILPVKPGPASGGESPAPVEAAHSAFDEAWPVLRHIFASEQLRLAAVARNRPNDHPLTVAVHAYIHEPAASRFRLGAQPWRTRVEDTRALTTRAQLDIESITAFLERGLQLEGARIEPDGSMRLLGSALGGAPGRPVTILGQPISLADFAVAERAVFQGGATEPYMSLDRGDAPQRSLVNYGGRLRDTGLGLVSLLCDIRFKTFSLGIDMSDLSDVREQLRRELPEFRTHLERFAADARSRGVMSQQTRLWFYPDSVDLTLSESGDLLAMRRVRMSAASERLAGLAGGTDGAQADPPWTLETVSAINRDYDALARFFPEMADLDQLVRLLSLFTWLRQAEADGLRIPDVDALLAVELPAQPTPRQFPQLLTLDAIPSAGPPATAAAASKPATGSGPEPASRVDVFERAPIGAALDRLDSPSGRPLPAPRRLARALASLDGRVADQAALAKEIQALDPTHLDETSLDALAARAERLAMHHLVLTTPTGGTRELLKARQAIQTDLRVFSIGIGGLDLGMSKPLARAVRRSETIQFGASGQIGGQGRMGHRPQTGRPGNSSDRTEAQRIEDPAGLARSPLPFSDPLDAGDGGVRVIDRNSGDSLVLYGTDSPDLRSRRVVNGPSGSSFERVEEMRLLRYRFDRSGSNWRVQPLTPAEAAALAPAPLVVPAPGRAADPALATTLGLTASPPLPEGIAELFLPEAVAGEAKNESSALRVRLRSTAGGEMKELQAPVPRALLRRLVLGHDADAAEGQPLRGLTPLPAALGSVSRLMVLSRESETTPPWAGVSTTPGEESAARLARAWNAWGSGIRAAVGTDPVVSARRWVAAPRADHSAMLLLPEAAFPASAGSLREQVRRAWGNRPSAGLLPASAPSLVVLVSAEAPGALSERLRALAIEPAMKGRQLAVISIGSETRPDLPGSLLAAGTLAGLGLFDASPAGLASLPRTIEAIGAAIDSAPAGGLAVEDLPGPLVWYY